ncbi:MAG: hypothetical protein K0U54_10130 [Bacteroidetes bacterium]|nr:hypothetical protein [Bacteroidota bacterium]
MTRKLMFGLFAFGIFLSCNSDDDASVVLGEQDFLIFGHFYGECEGERCVETFKLTNTDLSEDTLDDYGGQERAFELLDDAVYIEVKDLINFFPQQLLSEEDTILGCPDCADGGGLYIQYSDNGAAKSWRIDQGKEAVPTYLHTFMDKVNEKIRLINN